MTLIARLFVRRTRRKRPSMLAIPYRTPASAPEPLLPIFRDAVGG